MKHSGVIFAAVWLILVALAAAFAPWLAPRDPLATNPAQSLSAPSLQHPLGTDLLGRDVLSRMVWGGRRTAGMALFAVALTTSLGSAVGLWAGHAGGEWDTWLMRGVDILLALPQLLVALIVVSAFGRGAWPVGIAVGLAGVASYARLARAVVQQVRGQPFIQAAESLGMSAPRVVVRHVLPNVAVQLASLTSIHFAWAVLNTAALTFLGFGGGLSTPDWGVMLNDGRAYLLSAPWVSTAPGLAITLTVLAVNTLSANLAAAPRRGRQVE